MAAAASAGTGKESKKCRVCTDFKSWSKAQIKQEVGEMTSVWPSLHNTIQGSCVCVSLLDCRD